jgi:hypothetical protein
LKTTILGRTGAAVSVLGAGLAEIGFELSLSAADVDQAGAVLNGALDSGVNLLDTAECYSVSEELIGRTVSGRRSEFFLATKCGHLGGQSGREWTYETVTGNINNSLRRMKTDHVDLVQLHSCGVEVLDRGDVIRALQDARREGKTRFIGYSGDNEAAHWAADSGLFDTLQTSFNIADQQARTTGLLKKAEARGMGIIIKRPIAGGTWGAVRRGKNEQRVRGYDDTYYNRNREMAEAGPVPGEPSGHVEFALGFVFAHPEPDVAIIGTKSPEHMASNIRLLEGGLSLDARAVEEMHRLFEKSGRNWRQLT